MIFVFSLNLINRSSTPGSISAEQRGDLSERVVKRVGRRPQLRALASCMTDTNDARRG